MRLASGMTKEKMAAKLAAIATEWKFTGGDHPGFIVDYGDEKPWDDEFAEYLADIALDFVWIYEDSLRNKENVDNALREELFEQLMADGYVKEA